MVLLLLAYICLGWMDGGLKKKVEEAVRSQNCGGGGVWLQKSILLLCGLFGWEWTYDDTMGENECGCQIYGQRVIKWKQPQERATILYQLTPKLKSPIVTGWWKQARY